MRPSTGSTTTSFSMSGPGPTAYKANVQVCARVRPLLLHEVEAGEQVSIKCRSTDDSVSVLAGEASSSSPSSQQQQQPQHDDTFYFDHVFNELIVEDGAHTPGSSTVGRDLPAFDGEDDIVVEAAQQRVFETIGKPLVEQQCQGVSTCVLVVGPTGGGKSHTLIGSDEKRQIPGLAIRMLAHLEEQLNERNDPRFVSVALQLSVYEMYGDRCKDLLLSGDGEVPTSSAGGSQALMRSATMSQVQMGGSSRRLKSSADLNGGLGSAEAEFTDVRIRSSLTGVHIEGIRKANISSRPEDTGELLPPTLLQEVLSDALQRRCAAGRSRGSAALAPKVHLIVDCIVKVADKVSGVSKSSTMRLVDMCGCEKANRVRAAGTLSTVHRSLHALRSVIDTLVDNVESSQRPNRKTVVHAPVVPYRDSMFTVLLSDALGGSCRTTVIATVAPSEHQKDDTVFALGLVQRMKAITCNVSTKEEVVECAVGALQKELSLLQQLAAASDANASGDVAAKQAQRQALASELQTIEADMQSAVADRAALEQQRVQVLEKLAYQDSVLEKMQLVLQKRTEARDASRSIEAELSSVAAYQTAATQQVANEVVLQEKRNAQILVHRQRQASIVRRHETMVSKMESAKQVAESNRRKELAALFRTATLLTKQHNDVRFLRSEIDKMQRMESALFLKLRERQVLISELATLNSEEQLKCDFLTEELDEVVEEWEAANRTRADAITEHKRLMKDWDEQKEQFCHDAEVADASMEETSCQRHQLTFEVGVRVVELEAEVDCRKTELALLTQQSSDACAETTSLELTLKQVLAEAALLPDRMRQYAEQEEKRRGIINKICVATLECEDLEADIRQLEDIELPSADQEIADHQRQLEAALGRKIQIAGSQDALERFVQQRVFSQETKAACSVSPRRPSLDRRDSPRRTVQ